MATQLNIRLDEPTIEKLDEEASERGVSRPQLVRQAIDELLKRLEDERIGEQYRRAYTAVPETEDEIARAEENARRYVNEEPWEKWW